MRAPQNRTGGFRQKLSPKRPWQCGSRKPERPLADKQQDVSRPDKEVAAHGRRVSSGVTEVSWEQTVAACGNSLVTALNTPEPHTFKDWHGGVWLMSLRSACSKRGHGRDHHQRVTARPDWTGH